MTSGLLSVSLAPVVGREHSWTLTDDDGKRVASGFLPVDLAGWWDEQADRAMPKGWQRYGNWDLRADVAVAAVRLPQRRAASRVDTALPKVRSGLRRDTTDALVKLFEKMQPDVAARFDAGAKKLVAQRWVGQLAGVIEDRHMAAAEAVGGHVADQLDFEDFDPEIMREYLRLNAGFVADDITSKVEDDIRSAPDDDEEDSDPVGHVFGILAGAGASSMASQMVTMAGNFAARDTAVKGGAAAKVWRVTSGNPRASHAAMNGETAAMDEKFSNGLMWPGDPEGGDASEVAECQCALEIVV